MGANAAMLTEVERLHKDGRPVLIGTTNVQMSDQTAKDLEERGVPCQVLLVLLLVFTVIRNVLLIICAYYILY